MNILKMCLGITTANLPNHQLEHIFLLHKTFLMNACHARWNSWIHVLANFCWFIFAYYKTVPILTRLIFDFAKSVLLVSTVLMVQKKELFIKSPKLQ